MIALLLGFAFIVVATLLLMSAYPGALTESLGYVVPGYLFLARCMIYAVQNVKNKSWVDVALAFLRLLGNRKK